MKLNRETLPNLRAEILADLEKLGKKHGVHFSFSGGSYSPCGTNATLKLELALIGENGVVEDKTRADFRQAAYMYGLAATDLDRVFQSGGREFKLVGLKTRSHRTPFICESTTDGKRYLFTETQVKISLGYISPGNLQLAKLAAAAKP